MKYPRSLKEDLGTRDFPVDPPRAATRLLGLRINNRTLEGLGGCSKRYISPILLQVTFY